MNKLVKRLLLASASSAMIFSSTVISDDKVELSLLIGNNPIYLKSTEAVIDAFEKNHPNIKIELDIMDGGSEGDNIVKTRLATGEMNDIFYYNTGSLFHAIHPKEYLVDLTQEPFMENVMDAFKSTVSEEGVVYGVPFQTASGAGIFYNRKIYQNLGLNVPKTWQEFMNNNERIKQAGLTPVMQTYDKSWTSQIILLADYYNVQKSEPDFANKYTLNQTNFTQSKAAHRGFEKLESLSKAGYLNTDFGSAKYEDGLKRVSLGEAAHYPMLTSAISRFEQYFPEQLMNIGFFSLPGDDPTTNGLTVWMPSSFYIPKSTEHLKEAKQFIEFAASIEGCNIQTQAVGVAGPYMVKGCTLPDNLPSVTQDLLSYFNDESKIAPALEFMSPIKGPSLEQILVEVGSGMRSADSASQLYDQDAKKQALQLGLPGWE